MLGDAERETSAGDEAQLQSGADNHGGIVGVPRAVLWVWRLQWSCSRGGERPAQASGLGGAAVLGVDCDSEGPEHRLMVVIGLGVMMNLVILVAVIVVDCRFGWARNGRRCKFESFTIGCFSWDPFHLPDKPPHTPSSSTTIQSVPLTPAMLPPSFRFSASIHRASANHNQTKPWQYPFHQLAPHHLNSNLQTHKPIPNSSPLLIAAVKKQSPPSMSCPATMKPALSITQAAASPNRAYTMPNRGHLFDHRGLPWHPSLQHRSLAQSAAGPLPIRARARNLELTITTHPRRCPCTKVAVSRSE
ncbi:hypothetical protein M0R45_025762 [Rubus argutus]|uniref:Uncharacterized protein n=1 Tax=Rubus argutus TaxID=59490 RepID=A0AAW1WX82_RUBAR